MVRSAHGEELVGWQVPAGEALVTNHDEDWFRVRARRGWGASMETAGGGRLDVDVRLGLAGERPVITGLVLIADEGSHITSTDLKQLSLPSLVESVFAESVEGDLPQATARPRGPGAPTITDHELREFAKTYMIAARENPSAPTKTVAEMWDQPMSLATARRWRARAEAAGHLRADG